MWCYTLFPKILNMSLTAGIVIILVLLARMLLKTAPKIFSYALWTVVLFRLLCPVSFSTNFSLLSIFNSPTVTENSITYIPTDIVHTEYPQVDLPISGISNAVNDVLPQGAEQVGADPLEAPMSFATQLWLFGMGTMLAYSIASLLSLRRKLVGAVWRRDNIYLADHIVTPFVIGVVRPKIYLPSTLSEREREYIILHEQTHIRRLDHIVKLVSFLGLSIHWFNPLVWVAFVLSGKDMEMSCDEAVMKKMDNDIRADYSASLLSLATGRKIFAGAPLAFGEGDTKSRIKNVLSYKKPAFWVVMAAIAAVSVLCVALISNPLGNGTDLMGANYRVEKMLYNTLRPRSVDTDRYFCITADYNLYMRETENEAWAYVGPLEAYPLTPEELYGYCFDDDGWRSGYKVEEIADAYILRLDDDYFYFAVQTASGDTLLAHGWEDTSERNQGFSDDTAIDWIFLLDSTLPEHGINANFFDRSLAASVGETVNCFSYFENDDTPGYMIVGFLADGSGEASDMGFAVFQSEDRRYKLLDYHVYANAAVIEVPEPTDSSVYIGIHLAEDPAVCGDSGAVYDVILSSNNRLTSVTKVADGVEVNTKTVDANPSMTVFLRTDDEQEISYEFTYDELSNHEISGLFTYSVSDIEKIEFQNGNTGELVSYTGETEINDIIEHLNAFRYDKTEPVVSSGWTYAIRLWLKDNADMQRITLTPSSASIEVNHYISSEHDYFPKEWLDKYCLLQENASSPEEVVHVFFQAFENADYEGMKPYCTQECIDTIFNPDDLLGMKWAKAISIEASSADITEDNETAVFVSIEMEIVSADHALYGSDQTSFFVILSRDEEGTWLIDRFVTG